MTSHPDKVVQTAKLASGVRAEARLVPFPSSISPQARAVLASFVNPDGTLREKLDAAAYLGDCRPLIRSLLQSRFLISGSKPD
jgi:hypothetical protein